MPGKAAPAQPPHLHPLHAHPLQQLGEDAGVRLNGGPVVAHDVCYLRCRWAAVGRWSNGTRGTRQEAGGWRQTGAAAGGPGTDCLLGDCQLVPAMTANDLTSGSMPRSPQVEETELRGPQPAVASRGGAIGGDIALPKPTSPTEAAPAAQSLVLGLLAAAGDLVRVRGQMSVAGAARRTISGFPEPQAHAAATCARCRRRCRCASRASSALPCPLPALNSREQLFTNQVPLWAGCSRALGEQDGPLLHEAARPTSQSLCDTSQQVCWARHVRAAAGCSTAAAAVRACLPSLGAAQTTHAGPHPPLPAAYKSIAKQGCAWHTLKPSNFTGAAESPWCRGLLTRHTRPPSSSGMRSSGGAKTTFCSRCAASGE